MRGIAGEVTRLRNFRTMDTLRRHSVAARLGLSLPTSRLLAVWPLLFD